MNFTAHLSRDGSSYLAQCQQLEVVGVGDSPSEALDDLRDAIELYFDQRGEETPRFELTFDEATELPIAD